MKSNKRDDVCSRLDNDDIFSIENYNRCSNCHSRNCRLQGIESFADWKLEVLNITWLGVGE